MKKIYGIVLILGLFLIGCTGGKDMRYTYELTYTDGTTERVVTQNKLDNENETDCVKSCGCGTGEEKWCGVRKFELISSTDLNNKVIGSGRKDIDDF